MMRTYLVTFTTEDFDEVTYRVTTTRGALAVVEAAMFQHHKAGHQVNEVREVKTEIGSEVGP